MNQKKKMMDSPLSQEEVKYDPNGGTLNPRSEACSTCRFFCERENGGGYECKIVDHFPAAIVPNGWCEWWTPLPSIEPEPLEVVIVEPDSEPFGVEERSRIGEIFNSAKEAVFNLIGRTHDSEDIIRYGGFKALGGGYWFAAHTNNFEDREKEILSESAHRRYILRTRMKLVPLPELWFHHMVGTKHGTAEFVGEAGHMVYSVGKYDDSEIGHAIEQFDRKAKPGYWGLSHGFTYPKWAKKGRVYEDYNTFEVSKLRPQYASNPYTPFVNLEGIMPITEQDKKLIEESFPGDIAKAIIANREKVETGGETIKTLLGAAYKDFVDASNTPDDSEKKSTGTDATVVLLPQILESQGDVIQLVAAMERKHASDMKSLQDTVKNLQGVIGSLNRALDIVPTPASEADETLVAEGDEKADAEKVLKDKKRGHVDPIFGDMNIHRPD